MLLSMSCAMFLSLSILYFGYDFSNKYNINIAVYLFVIKSYIEYKKQKGKKIKNKKYVVAK